MRTETPKEIGRRSFVACACLGFGAKLAAGAPSTGVVVDVPSRSPEETLQHLAMSQEGFFCVLRARGPRAKRRLVGMSLSGELSWSTELPIGESVIPAVAGKDNLVVLSASNQNSLLRIGRRDFAGNKRFERLYPSAVSLASVAAGGDRIVAYFTNSKLTIFDSVSGALVESHANVLPVSPIAGITPQVPFVSVTSMGGGEFLILDHVTAAAVVYDASTGQMRSGHVAAFVQQAAENEKRYKEEIADLPPGVLRPFPLVVSHVAPGRPGSARMMPGRWNRYAVEFQEVDSRLSRIGGGTLLIPAQLKAGEKVPTAVTGSADTLALGYQYGTLAVYKAL